MNTLKNRLAAVEERNAFEVFKQQRAVFCTKTEDELEFFATFGRFPDDPAIEPKKREFTVGAWKTTVILERA